MISVRPSVSKKRLRPQVFVGQLGCKVLCKKQMKLSPNKNCFKASKSSFSKALCSSASPQEEFPPLLGQRHDRHMWAPRPPAKLPANSVHSAARGLCPSDSLNTSAALLSHDPLFPLISRCQASMTQRVTMSALIRGTADVNEKYATVKNSRLNAGQSH